MSYKQISLIFKKFEDPDLLEVAAERIRLVNGVVNVEPLFPETDNEEEKRYYVVEVVPTAVGEALDQLLNRLLADPNVELAYDPPSRTL